MKHVARLSTLRLLANAIGNLPPRKPSDTRPAIYLRRLAQPESMLRRIRFLARPPGAGITARVRAALSIRQGICHTVR
jgi:hypothetical protein